MKSDISPAVRFFVFPSKPDPERLVRIEGPLPVSRPAVPAAADDLVDRVYLHLLSRKPEAEEKAIGLRMMSGAGGQVSASGLEDFLWAMMMSPEFQFIR